MSTHSVASSRRHSPWQDLLQIFGAIAVVAFHTGFPGAKGGWAAVELFFALAGFRMASSRDDDPGIMRFLMDRTRRLLPELTVVWLVCLALVVVGSGTHGMRWFLSTAPFHLQNVSVLFFDYRLPRDAVFGPLWFTASLVQLQLLCFLLRNPLRKANPWLIAGFAVAIGIVARAAFIRIQGGSITHPSGNSAGVLYCMPFCHMEAMVFGWLLKRGAFSQLGKLMPLVVPCILGAGLLIAGTKNPGLRSDFGYVFPLRDNLSYAWGYPLLALGAISMIAIQPAMDGFLTGLKWLRMPLAFAGRMALLTYGIYCFHGMFIAGFAAIEVLNSPGIAGHFVRLSAVVLCSLAIAIVVRWISTLSLRNSS